MPTIRNWQLIPLAAPRQCLIHTNPRSAAYDIYSAGLPLQCLVKLQFRYRLCIDTSVVQHPIMPGFRSQVCRLVKLNLRDCLKHRIQSSQPLRKLHFQRR